MAITVCGNCINFGTYSLCNAPTGVCVNGSFKSKNILLRNPQQGSVSGYATGGEQLTGAPSPGSSTDRIDKYSFTSDTNSTSSADLTQVMRAAAGSSSSTHGYVSGGNIFPTPLVPVTANIEKFSFSSDTNAVCIEQLAGAIGLSEVSGASSAENGYVAGGLTAPPFVIENRIQRFPFSSDAPACCIGVLFEGNRQMTGISSSQNAYFAFGTNPTPVSVKSYIQRVNFASDGNSILSGEQATQCRRQSAGANSTEFGYVMGGSDDLGGIFNIIEKFPFAADGYTTTDVGDLTQISRFGMGSSSVTDGYLAGGDMPNPLDIGRIEKFPFASDTNSADVAEMGIETSAGTGHQV